MAYAVYDIKLEQVGQSMSDGDTIRFYDQGRVCPPDQIQIGLQLVGNVDWWKGIILFNQEGYQTVIDRAGPNRDVAYGIIKTSDLIDINQEGGVKYLVLGKAKAFGVHTNEYCITNANQKLIGGHQYLFKWEKD
ncbi:hypothetical protein [Nostoc sp. 106C]|uniref:hypothetical protein n=1 Tax=Nostoc sp. 106C TaxID=1932667 RepID=UPI000A379D4E|nr:hypothetical protein [Nostoc sp. 106C]OUL26825.1 hypothetical protein BV375_20435 [Nostoc sp. 106C]